jgi:hypothetical protein
MRKYTLRFANSRSSRPVATVQEGLDILRADYPDLVHTTDVDRVIVWEDEASSENDDDGRHAVAEITWGDDD